MDTLLQKMSKEELISNLLDLRKKVAENEEEISNLKNKVDLSSNTNAGLSKSESMLRMSTESEDKFKVISELTSDFAYAFSVQKDNQLKYEWGFGALKKITGYSREELHAQGGWETLIYNDDLKIALEQFNQLLKGEANTFEYRILDNLGKIHWVRDYAKPIINQESGKLEFIYGAIQDITERKEVEESLRFANLVLENSPAVLFRWKAEQGWPVAFVSHNVEQFGYTQKELLSGEIPYLSIIHPDDIERVGKEVDQYSSDGLSNFRQEYRIICKDGRICWTDDRTKIEKDEEGNIKFYQGIVLDITESKIAEESLKESEERLRLALNSANQGLYDLDLQTGEAIVSDEYASMLGYEPKSFVESNEKWLARLHPDDLDITRKIYQSYVNNEIPEYKVEFRQKTNTNNWKWIQSSGKIVERDKTGKPVRMLGIHTDINDKKKIEFALRESEQQYKLLFSKNPNLMFVFDRETLRFLDANDSAVRHYGFTHKEFLGMTVKDIRPKEDIPKMLKVIDSLEGRVTTAKGYRHRKKNGEIIYVNATNSPIEFNGRPAEVVVIDDITEKHIAEQALKESEEKFKSVFTDSHDCIYVTSADGKIINMNKAGLKLFGINEDEISSYSVSDLYISLQERENFLNNIADAGFVKDYSVKLRNKSGKILDCLLTASLRRDASGKIISYQGIIRDITEEKRAQIELIKAKEQAEKADRLKTEFLAQMSHEIRTPINTLLSFSSLIREETKDIENDELNQYFNYQRSAGKRIIRTIDLVLNMSEVQTGSFQLSIRELNLVELMNEIFIDYKNIAIENGLEIMFEKIDADVRIKGDDYSVRQIFSNLIDNSIKYTPSGSITLSIKKMDRKALVVVSDTGIGIAKEYLNTIFQPFTQEEQGYTRKFEGSGLGLSLVKKYCEFNNAEISVESEKNVGTKFLVSFDTIE